MRFFALLMFASSVACAMPVSLLAGPPGADGLSAEDARTAAISFLADEGVNIEASVGMPVLDGDEWVCPLRVGAAGIVDRDPVLVNRHTAKVTWAGLAPFRRIRGGG